MPRFEGFREPDEDKQLTYVMVPLLLRSKSKMYKAGVAQVSELEGLAKHAWMT
jgi:hypothetical protein